MMINLRFLVREMVSVRGQAAIFVLCVALSITSLVALNSFSRDVRSSLMGDAKALHGGDVLLHSHYPFSPGLLSAVENLGLPENNLARTWEFYSVARGDDSSVLAGIKVVSESYPLYGTVSLRSGSRLQDVLHGGTVVVGSDLLIRLGAGVGETIFLGDSELTIVDVVASESTRPVEIVNFGPRIFVAEQDLDQLGLVKTGSRVAYGYQLRLPPGMDEQQVEKTLISASIEGQERVRTYRTAGSGLKRFFDNLLFFLSLIAVFTLILAGIGMRSSVVALLKKKENSFAIIRSLGASYRFIFSHYLLLVLIYGLVGAVLGVGAGYLFKLSFPLLFSGIIPAGTIGGLVGIDVLEGVVVGLAVVLFFTYLPLYELREIKPVAVFGNRKTGSGRDRKWLVVAALGVLLFSLLVIRQLEDLKTGLYFTGASLGLILLAGVLVQPLLIYGGRIRIRSLALRQALRSMLRPGNGTRPVIVTVGTALGVLLMIYQVQYNLRTTYVESYPPDAPNVFMVDIQNDQVDDMQRLLGGEVEFHPIIRARLQSINGVEVRGRARQERFSDSLRREFNLTYRENMLADELLAEGDGLFGASAGVDGTPVSVLDMVAEMGDMEIGDRLMFNIQGVEMGAEVSSIRSRSRSMLYPFFYFVFPTDVLAKAPKTFFAALHVNEQEIGPLQQRVVDNYPNVSVINMSEAAVELGAAMGKLSGIVTFFALFSIVAGCLILIGSILATRLARLREAAYYKVLGAKYRFVFSVFLYENLVLGGVSSCLAVLFAQVGSWVVCDTIFEISYAANWTASAVAIFLTLLMFSVVGMVGQLSIIRQRPGVYLREQSVE